MAMRKGKKGHLTSYDTTGPPSARNRAAPETIRSTFRAFWQRDEREDEVEEATNFVSWAREMHPATGSANIVDR
jgi:hypothetical protein